MYNNLDFNPEFSIQFRMYFQTKNQKPRFDVLLTKDAR